MGVKKLLAKQKEDFLNLHEVLCGMTATDGSSYEEAAQALCHALRDASDGEVIWYVKPARAPKKPLSDEFIETAFQCLTQASLYGHLD
jgi:hypothetical protein